MTAQAALAAAGRGTRAWRSVAMTQAGAAEPDFHELAGELLDTVRALELVAAVLLRQVHGYGDGLVFCDDEGQDPTDRLIAVAASLADLHCALGRADRAASGLWSQVGHIAVEVL
jgi:hypothetical protein